MDMRVYMCFCLNRSFNHNEQYRTPKWASNKYVSLHEILDNELVNDDAWNFAEYKAKCVAVEETLWRKRKIWYKIKAKYKMISIILWKLLRWK